jgi:hypothetical protein
MAVFLLVVVRGGALPVVVVRGRFFLVMAVFLLVVAVLGAGALLVVTLTHDLLDHRVEFLELPVDFFGLLIRHHLERPLVLGVGRSDDDGGDHSELLVGLAEVVVDARGLEGMLERLAFLRHRPAVPGFGPFGHESGLIVTGMVRRRGMRPAL